MFKSISMLIFLNFSYELYMIYYSNEAHANKIYLACHNFINENNINNFQDDLFLTCYNMLMFSVIFSEYSSDAVFDFHFLLIH